MRCNQKTPFPEEDEAYLGGVLDASWERAGYELERSWVPWYSLSKKNLPRGHFLHSCSHMQVRVHCEVPGNGDMAKQFEV